MWVCDRGRYTSRSIVANGLRWWPATVENRKRGIGRYDCAVAQQRNNEPTGLLPKSYMLVYTWYSVFMCSVLLVLEVTAVSSYE